MRITVRRLLIPMVLVAAACVAAAPVASEDSSLPVIGQLASALSQRDSVSALEVFDSKMEQYGRVESAISALTAQADILCAIEVVEEKEAGETLTADTDWYLQLKSRSDGGTTERRRQRVTLQFKKLRGKWRITALSPVNVLDPITVR